MNYDEFKAGLKHRGRRDLIHPQERCPDSPTLASYAAGDLDATTRSNVGVHVAFCEDCSLELSVLDDLERTASWRKLIEGLKSLAVDFTQTYGPGAMLGSVRILAENQAFGVRGESEPLFKIVDIPVGDNRYSVKVEITPERSVHCNIESLDTARNAPLVVTTHSESGEILYATETDTQGKANFVLSQSEVSGELCVLMFTLGDQSNNLVLRVPEVPGV